MHLLVEHSIITWMLFRTTNCRKPQQWRAWNALWHPCYLTSSELSVYIRKILKLKIMFSRILHKCLGLCSSLNLQFIACYSPWNSLRNMHLRHIPSVPILSVNTRHSNIYIQNIGMSTSCGFTKTWYVWKYWSSIRIIIKNIISATYNHIK